MLDKTKTEINLISSCKHLVYMLVIEGMEGLLCRKGVEKLMSQTAVLSRCKNACYMLYRASYPMVLDNIFYI